MKHIKLFENFNVDEMAQITRKGKKVFADDKLLKDVSFNDLGDNTLLYHEKNGNWFIPKDKFYLYFLDSDDATKKVISGDYDLLFFPPRTNFNLFTVSPITDVWKKNKNTKGKEHYLGMVEGYLDRENKRILIMMMSVRPGFKGNKINSILMDTIQDSFKDLDFKLCIEEPTDDGIEFIMKYMPDADVEWNGREHRPKAWYKYHPEDLKKKPTIQETK